MSRGPRPALLLALALCPDRAAALAGRLRDPPPPGALAAEGMQRQDRLASLAEVLRALAVPARPPRSARPAAARLAVELATRAAGRTDVRVAAADAARSAAGPAALPAAREVLEPDGMFPFDLACASPASVDIDGSVLQAAERAARAAEAGLASVLGGEVRIRGRLLPDAASLAATSLVPVELTALAGQAHLAVDCGFAARLAERVAGGGAATPAATSLSPAERTVLDLAVLAALDGLAAEPGVEEALAPRLGTHPSPLARPLCVELSIDAAGTEGRALLLVPDRAVRALRGTSGWPPRVGDAAVEGSLLGGRISIDGDELREVRDGDVLLLDEPAGDGALLELPGGTSVRGRLGDEGFEVDAVTPEGSGEGASVPVVIDVELAAVAVPVRDLARLVPGAVLALGIDRRGLVTLRIGSRAVARGELVEVDGAVGVRVLRERAAG